MEGKNIKIPQASKQIENIMQMTSDEKLRAENASKHFEYQEGIYGRGIKQIGEADPEIQKMTFWADLNLNEKFIENRNKKETDLEEKTAEVKRLQNVVNKLETSITELQEKINAGGILPVKKEELKKQLVGLEKIQTIVRSDASLALAQMESISNKEYIKPRTPGGDISKN
ncbi:MAG: hypothetical protein WAV23_00575 [Minisyncoccia bacterium]